MVARSLLGILVVLALAPVASGAYVSVEPTGHAFADILAVSGVGDADAHCRMEVCLAASGRGEAEARCADRTLVCLAASGVGRSRTTCEFSACVAVSGTGPAEARCRIESPLCQARTLGPTGACVGSFGCATLDEEPSFRSCQAGRCAVVATFGDAEGTAAVSAFGHSRSDTLAVSGTDSATGTRTACSPPPHSTSACPGAVAVSGLGNAKSDRRCDASFCTGRLAASGTGDADGHFAVSLTGDARGAVTFEPGRELSALRLQPAGAGPLPALP